MLLVRLTAALVVAVLFCGSGEGRARADLLLVTSYHGNEIRSYDTTTGAFEGVFASTGLNNPIGLTFGPDGNLYAANYTSSQITRYDGTSGAFLGVFASGSGLSGPQGIIFRGNDLYVSSRDSDSILRYDSSGNLLGAFVAPGSGGLYRPNGLGFGADGNLYVSSQASDQILKFDGTTGAFLSVFATIPDDPHGLAFDGLGNLYVGNFIGDTYRLDATTGALLQSFHSGGSYLALGPDGFLYDSAGLSSISRYNSATGAYIDTPISDPGLNNPAGFAFRVRSVPEPGAFALMGAGLIVYLPFVLARKARGRARLLGSGI